MIEVKESALLEGESVRYWDVVMEYGVEYSNLRQEQICVTIGACNSTQFEIPLAPVRTNQLEWYVIPIIVCGFC